MDSALIEACKRLKLGSGVIARAKKIKAKTHTDFLLELFTGELEERDRKRRNAYIKAAGFRGLFCVPYFFHIAN